MKTPADRFIAMLILGAVIVVSVAIGLRVGKNILTTYRSMKGATQHEVITDDVNRALELLKQGVSHVIELASCLNDSNDCLLKGGRQHETQTLAMDNSERSNRLDSVLEHIMEQTRKQILVCSLICSMKGTTQMERLNCQKCNRPTMHQTDSALQPGMMIHGSPKCLVCGNLQMSQAHIDLLADINEYELQMQHGG